MFELFWIFAHGGVENLANQLANGAVNFEARGGTWQAVQRAEQGLLKPQCSCNLCETCKLLLQEPYFLEVRWGIVTLCAQRISVCFCANDRGISAHSAQASHFPCLQRFPRIQRRAPNVAFMSRQRWRSITPRPTQEVNMSYVTKGSVSYLSSPCFSTSIGGIGGPARAKRGILAVMY